MTDILHISNTYGPKGGGISEAVLQFHRYQSDFINSEVWFPSSKKTIDSSREDSGVIALKLIGPSTLAIPEILVRKLPTYTGKYKILHQHGIWMPISLLSLKIKRIYEPKFVLQPHGLLMPNSLKISSLKKKLVFKLYEKRNITTADVLIGSSISEIEALKKLFPNKPVAFIPLGISREFLECPSLKKTTKSGKKQILFLSQIIPVKKVERVLQSIHILGKEKFKDWEFQIAGYGDVQYIKYLNKLVETLNLKDVVKFLGPVYGQDKIGLIDNSDIFILPSESENFGLVVLEALSRGVPIITTNGTPWTDLQTHNCGIYTENSLDGIQKGLLKLLRLTSKELSEMGTRGRKLAADRYLWELNASKTIKLYKWLEGEIEKPEFIY